jgi:hypothetical protein
MESFRGPGSRPAHPSSVASRVLCVSVSRDSLGLFSPINHQHIASLSFHAAKVENSFTATAAMPMMMMIVVKLLTEQLRIGEVKMKRKNRIDSLDSHLGLI